jgi:hypothetical protein
LAFFFSSSSRFFFSLSSSFFFFFSSSSRFFLSSFAFLSSSLDLVAMAFFSSFFSLFLTAPSLRKVSQQEP